MESSEGLANSLDIERFKELVSKANSSKDIVSNTVETNVSLALHGDMVDRMLAALGRPRQWSEGVEGLKVADIGCGSELYQRGNLKYGYPPLFSRICALKGATVVGVDLKKSILEEDELYRHITADIFPSVMKGKLGELLVVRPGELDAINCAYFVEDIGEDHILECAPDLSRRLEVNGVDKERFKRLLFDQFSNLLKPGGIVMLTNVTYKKEGSVLVKVGKEDLR